MATFLDVVGLEYFSNFFVFIFVWLVVYAVFTYTKFFGQNKAIGIIIGLIIGIFVLFSPNTVSLIQYIAPWFAIIFVFVILISVTTKMFGATEIDSLASLRVISLILIIITVIVGSIGYIGSKVGVGGNETGEEKDYSKIKNFLLHPKFLGMLFVLLIAVFTVALLAGKTL